MHLCVSQPRQDSPALPPRTTPPPPIPTLSSRTWFHPNRPISGASRVHRGVASGGRRRTSVWTAVSASNQGAVLPLPSPRSLPRRLIGLLPLVRCRLVRLIACGRILNSQGKGVQPSVVVCIQCVCVWQIGEIENESVSVYT